MNKKEQVKQKKKVEQRKLYLKLTSLIFENKTRDEIAKELNYSKGAVNHHLSNLYRVFNATDRISFLTKIIENLHKKNCHQEKRIEELEEIIKEKEQKENVI